MHASDNNKLHQAINNHIINNSKIVNKLIEKRNKNPEFYDQESLTCLGYLCCMPYINNYNRRIQSLCDETKNLITIQEKIQLMDRAIGSITTEVNQS
jgi:hypothetical protein